jgi:hypothetical protein
MRAYLTDLRDRFSDLATRHDLTRAVIWGIGLGATTDLFLWALFALIAG